VKVGGNHSLKQQGFTLMEVMIVVLIIAVLAGIAYASYQNQVIKSRRATAAVCLEQRAQFMERYYTTNMTYVGAPAPAACDDVANFYTVSFNGAVGARTFQLQAVPQGIQASKDTACATLRLNAQGVRSVTGSDTVANCW